MRERRGRHRKRDGELGGGGREGEHREKERERGGDRERLVT